MRLLWPAAARAPVLLVPGALSGSLFLPRRFAAAACDDDDDDVLSEGLQIVGMSATLPNVDKVAK